jgi:hypothetical protein
VAFLRKHYEKVILAAFLLVFILLLVWLIMIFSKSMEISEQDLMITPRQANYQRGSESDYQAEQALAQQTIWQKAAPRSDGTVDYTALLIPFEISRCPADKGCGRFIPLSAFGSEEAPGKCPLCGIPLDLPKPGIDGEPVGPAGQDTDGDGITDVIEVKYGMNPANPADANYDLDKDGFSNIYEITRGFEPNDAKSHPPLAERLALKGINRRQLPMVLKKVVARDGDDKDRWDIQVDVQTSRGVRTRFERLGNTIKLDNDSYVIKDVLFKTTEVEDRRLGSRVTKDISEIVIQRGEEPPITAVVGQKVMEPNPRIVLFDYHAKRNYTLQQGEEFTMGSRGTGSKKYILQDVDDQNNAVTVRDKADGTVHPVTSVAKSPIPELPGEERRSMEFDPMMGPMGSGPMGPGPMGPGPTRPPRSTGPTPGPQGPGGDFDATL